MVRAVGEREWAPLRARAFNPGDTVLVDALVQRGPKGKKCYQLDQPLLVSTPVGPGTPVYEKVRFMVPVDEVPFAIGERIKVPLFIISLTNDPMSRVALQDEETTINVKLATPEQKKSRGALVDLFPPHLAPTLFQRLSGNRNARWFHHDNFHSYHFTNDDLRVLLGWGGSEDRRSAPRILNRLVAAPLDSTREGKDARDALVELGFLNPFSGALLEELPARFESKPLKKVHFHYNGHMTCAMFPLFPILQSLGLSSGSATRSGYSGTYPMEGIMNAQLGAGGARPYERDRLSHARVGPVKEDQPPHSWMQKCALEAVRKGEIFIADKAAPLLAGNPPPELIDAMRAGKIRFLIHNSDDRRALEPYLGEIYAVDVAGSMLKAMEATLIGEQYALLAAREVREKMGARVKDVAKIVIGAGLLGTATAEAMARLAAEDDTPSELRKARGQIVLVDSDAKARQEAEALGFKACAPEAIPPAARGVAVVATTGAGVTADTVPHLPRNTVVLGLTSAGKGIDVASLRRAVVDQNGSLEEVKTREGAHGVDRFTPREMHDLAIRIGDRKLTVINEGFPLNLFEESWSDRFTLTAAAVSLGVVTAAKLDPKKDPPQLYQVPELDSIFVRDLFEKAGLHRPYPLTTHDASQLAALAADMKAYR